MIALDLPHRMSLAARAAAAVLLIPLAAQAQTRPAATQVFNDKSPWRVYASWRTPATVTDGKYDLGKGYATTGTRWVKSEFAEPTPPPPADWMAAGFDDVNWPRRSGPVFGGQGYAAPADVYLLCLRGRFGIDDPNRAGQLKLDLSYRGGVVVYLNGTEIARGHLPNGKVEPLTLAEDYGKEAFVGPDGAPLPVPSDRAPTPPANLLPSYNKRVRTLSVDLPGKLLVKGTNVLALEIHRAAVPGQFAGGKSGWSTCGLVGIALTAPADSTAQPNVAPPAGPHIWNCDSFVRAGTDVSVGDPFEPLRPIAMGAPRNGVASGQIVVSAAAPLNAVTASMGALKSDKGATLDAACVQVRYATGNGAAYPMLLDKPPASAAVQPIWLTARVPKDAAAGVYRGELALSGMDKPVSVPVQVTVYDWTLPDLRDYGTSISLLHCPESVAGYYKTPLWSDGHFKALEKSLEMLGYAGNTLFSLPIIAEDLFGDHPAVVFRKEAGGIVPDLRFARRYLELHNKVAGAPRQLSMQVWNYSVSRRGVGRDGGGSKWMAQTIKVRFLEGDKLVPGEMPLYGAPGTEATWSAVAKGVRDIMKDLGWTRTRLLWGTGGDNLPTDEIVAFFKKLDPLIYWRVATHGGSVAKWGKTPEQRTQSNGLILGYANMVRRNVTFRELVDDCPYDSIKRDGISPPPMDYLSLPPLGRIAARYSGCGFIPFDHWTYTTPEGTQRKTLAGYTNFGNITPHCPSAFVMPGPDGPAPTPQLEAFREGLQVTEAVLRLRAALADPQRKGSIKDELIAEATAAIQGLMDVMESNRRVHPSGVADAHWLINKVYALTAQVVGNAGR